MRKDAPWFLVGALLALLLPQSVHASVVGPFVCAADDCTGCAGRGYASLASEASCGALFVNADAGTTLVLTPNGDVPSYQNSYPLGVLAQGHPPGCSALYSDTAAYSFFTPAVAGQVTEYTDSSVVIDAAPDATSLMFWCEMRHVVGDQAGNPASTQRYPDPLCMLSDEDRVVDTSIWPAGWDSVTSGRQVVTAASWCR